MKKLEWLRLLTPIICALSLVIVADIRANVNKIEERVAKIEERTVSVSERLARVEALGGWQWKQAH